MKLRGVTLVYGPAGAGKTTFTAFYVLNNYDKIFWVSAFEDETTFRSNMAALGYNFGEKLIFWEAPLADVASFFTTLVESVVRDRPGAVVIDSITEFLGAGGGLDILHNVVYRVIKQANIDVFLTAEKDVAERVTYIADNVIEIVYDVRPYGAYRELVVRKVRGGRAGYAIPLAIAEGLGVVFLKQGSEKMPKVETIKAGMCLDEATGGLYKTLLHAVIGPMGAGKNWLMLNTAKSLLVNGYKAVYLDIAAGRSIYAERWGVPAINIEANLEEILVTLYKVTREGCDAVFIRGLDLMKAMYGKESLYTVLKILRSVAQMGPAVVVSLRSLDDFDMFFDVIINVNRGVLQAVRSPGGRVGTEIPCQLSLKN